MRQFGTRTGGERVDVISLRAGGMTAQIITLGAILRDLRLEGVPYSLTVGSDDLADYEGKMRHHGAIIGPVVNRISTARVRIDGLDYELERNQDGRINLHSGTHGIHRRVWTVEEVAADTCALRIDLGDGECGLPGNRWIRARFTLSEAALTLDIDAGTDAKTPINIANHSYWNLDGSDNWTGHTLSIAADRYLPTTPDMTPTGEIADVTGTPMDFREPRAMTPQEPPLDHNFCLSDAPVPLRKVLFLRGQSGVRLEMETDQPGLQVFDNRPDYRALAFEAQNWPDAPTWPAFPSIMLGPEETYRQRTRWRFFQS